MFTSRRQSDSRSQARAGFTLVEMLVAVALVLLMMTMFAEIFTLATGSMSKQKGLAELDQRQRLTSTLLRDDLRQRSFRNLFAYHPEDDSIHVQSANRPINVPFGDRQGYFYISENDPENDSDDELQFTVTRKDGTLFYGRTRELLDAAGYGAGANPNQPENDDGAFFGEGLGVGTSPSAEVAYFLRNGTLYRRVLLIRRPTDTVFPDAPSSGPLGAGPGLIQSGVYPQGPSSIYVAGGSAGSRYPQDFDYSATNLIVGPQLVILGETSLQNLLASPRSLGMTSNRFGFSRATGLLPASGYPIGKPLEYMPNGDYIGRFTHEETSHLAFAWPGNPGTGPDGNIATGDDTNPYTRSGLAMSPNGVVTMYAGGPRQGEDILLTNVQNFDVKIWDPGASVGPDGAYGIAGIDDDGVSGIDNPGELGWPGSDDGAWADIGHDGIGYFSQANNHNIAYGPDNPLLPAMAAYNHPYRNRCFDTWHADLGGTLGLAPFRPALPGYDGAPGRANVDDDNADGDNDNTTGADDAAELGWPNSDDIPVSIKAIKIRIRYLDVSSGLIREISIIEQLTPDAI